MEDWSGSKSKMEVIWVDYGLILDAIYLNKDENYHRVKELDNIKPGSR